MDRLSDKPLREALQKTVDGLLSQIPPDPPNNLFFRFPDKCSYSNCRWMMEQCQKGIDTLPVDKISRWIGFVQGVLASRNVIDVNAERDRTRPFFHEAYAEMGVAIPESKDS